MPYKDPQRKKEYMKERYTLKKEELKKYQKLYRAEHPEIGKDRSVYQRKHYIETRIARRVALMIYMGGQCIECGEDDLRMLTFHHRDPNTKSFDIGRALVRNIKKTDEEILEEAGKCDLLCLNHHNIRHNNWTEEEVTLAIAASGKYFTSVLDSFSTVLTQLAKRYFSDSKTLESVQEQEVNKSDDVAKVPENAAG